MSKRFRTFDFTYVWSSRYSVFKLFLKCFLGISHKTEYLAAFPALILITLLPMRLYYKMMEANKP